MTDTILKQTIGIVTALDVVLDSLGIKENTETYKTCKNLFAKTMGQTLAKIELDEITKQVNEAKPYEG